MNIGDLVEVTSDELEGDGNIYIVDKSKTKKGTIVKTLEDVSWSTFLDDDTRYVDVDFNDDRGELRIELPKNLALYIEEE